MSDARDSIDNLLKGYGIPPGPFRALLDQAVRSGWSGQTLLAHIYASKAFHKMFPGIFRADGTLKMSPGQYRHLTSEYRHLAAQYGYHAYLDNRQIVGKLVQRGISPDELKQRFEAVERIKEYQPSMEAFQDTLRQLGYDPRIIAGGPKTQGKNTLKTVGKGGGVQPDHVINGEVSDDHVINKPPPVWTQREMFMFLTRRAAPEFYKIWELTQIRTGASDAGLKLSDEDVNKISKLDPGRLTEMDVSEKFSKLAQDVRTIMPLSQMGNYGLTNSDLIDLEFGGPKQAEVAELAQRLLDQHKSNLENKAQPGVDPYRLSGRPQ